MDASAKNSVLGRAFTNGRLERSSKPIELVQRELLPTDDVADPCFGLRGRTGKR